MDDIYENPSALISGPFCKVTFEQTNINSPVQLKGFLLSQGWQPTQWTAPTKTNPKGSPQLTEDSYSSIKGDLGKVLAEKSVLEHRLKYFWSIPKSGKDEGKLKGWLNTVRDDGRLEAGGIPQGTNTGRYTHFNVANVVKADEEILYGEKIRDLFIAKPGYKLMGVDAAGLEARMEAHYCFPYPGGQAHMEDLLNGDVHQKTADMLGISRKQAKTVKYALMYGAFPKKISKTLKCSMEEAQKIYDGFWRVNPALARLKKEVESSYSARKFLIGLDRRKLLIREQHKLVNTLLQSSGSIVVKTATIYMANWVGQRNLDAKQVMHFHDEFTYEFHPRHEEEICELARQAFKKAGEYWKLNVPIEGDPKVGQSWRDIH